MLSVLKISFLLLSMSFFQYSHAYSRILSDSIKYSIDFKFNDGVFLNFKQVRANQAIPFKNIISKENYLSDTFVSDVLSKKKLFIFVNGEKKEILISDIWGYAKNGVLYVQYSKSFYRIPSVGSISFFVANVEVKYQSQVDPWNSNYYNTMSQDYTTKELRKFLIDFKDGTLYDYSMQNISKLISENTSLFKEFTALKKRKQKQMAFIFIRRFNESRPLFFPTY